jgi:hypothetical protein
MTIIRAQIALGHDSGLPEDVTINNLYFDGNDTDTVATALAAAIDDFFGGANVTATVESRLSTQLSGAGTIKFYDMLESTPRVPFATKTFTLTPSATALPGEVACCMSFQASPVSGLNQARRRGRIFLGPLANSNGTTGVMLSNTDPQVHANFRTDVCTAASRLKVAANAANAPWVVWSTVNQTAALINTVWVDNALDTQRRRGLKPTTRTTSSI